jgi:Fur family ferric uptake transcriptional regulator
MFEARESVLSVVALLREHGLRVTPQRLLLVEIVRGLPGHFTADQVYNRVRAVYPGVSKVSVYRGLDTLREQGMVTCTELGQHAARYEWSGASRHHHLICSHCGQQQDVPDGEVDALRERLAAGYGFHATIDHLAIWGLCKVCSRSGS